MNDYDLGATQTLFRGEFALFWDRLGLNWEQCYERKERLRSLGIMDENGAISWTHLQRSSHEAARLLAAFRRDGPHAPLVLRIVGLLDQVARGDA